jgi:membrane associated rhomboid family serine protease
MNVTPVTSILLFINCAVYILTSVQSQNLMNMDSEVLFRMGTSSRELLWEGDWLRLIAPMFLHGGLLHILMNMMTLKSFGPYLEHRLGGSNFASLYLLSGICSFCISQMCGGNQAVGASGSIFGLLGADLAIRILETPLLKNVWRNSEVRMRVYVLLFLIGFGFLANWLGGGVLGRMDNWAHLGGAVAGCVFGLLFESWYRRGRLSWAAIALPLVLTAALIGSARWTWYSPYYYVHQGAIAREEKRSADAEKHFAEALKWGERWGMQKRVALVIASLESGSISFESVRIEGYTRLDRRAKLLLQ